MAARIDKCTAARIEEKTHTSHVKKTRKKKKRSLTKLSSAPRALGFSLIAAAGSFLYIVLFHWPALEARALLFVFPSRLFVSLG